MEKTFFRQQAKNRLSGTMLRLGWLIAVCAFVPVLLYGMMFAMAFGAVLRIVILTMFVIITLGAILLNEKFLSLFHMESMEQAEVIVQTTSAAYQTIMPIFLVLSAIFLIGNLLIVCKSGTPQTGRLVSAILSTICTVVAAVIFYAGVL